MVTSEFWAQGNFVATAEGMPDIPRLELPHPVAGIGRDAMDTLATNLREAVLVRLSEG